MERRSKERKQNRGKDVKEEIVEMAWATSSSVASMTGAVAAMADPPQMDEPTPIRVALLTSMFMAFAVRKRFVIAELNIFNPVNPAGNLSGRNLMSPISREASQNVCSGSQYGHQAGKRPSVRLPTSF